MNQMKIDESILPIIDAAREKHNTSKKHSMAIELSNGKIITGRETDLLSPSSSLIINTIKEITKIPDEVDLLSSNILKPILKFKKGVNDTNDKLNLQETLITLSVCSVTNPIIGKAMNNLKKIEGCDIHSTYVVPSDELKTLKELKLNLTCDPVFYTDNL